MTLTFGLGLVFAAGVAVMKYMRLLTWPQLLVTFTAGVLLSGSAVGIMTSRAAVGGAQVVQSGISAVQSAANQPSPAPAPVAPRRAAAPSKPKGTP